MSDAQINALWGFLAAFSTVLWIGAAAVRARVYAPATVAAIEAKAAGN
jgi:hypothetical protein